MSLKQSARILPLLCAVGMTLLLAAQSKPSRSTSVESTQQDGKKTFLANCSGCHGLDGSGGERAPSIAFGSDASKLGDADLRRIVTAGIADAGMPSFHTLGGAGIKSVVAYLRILQGKGNNVQMPGDPDRGSILFFGKAQCSECHMAHGKGGFIAGDLTAYGQGRAPAEIRKAIVAPESDVDQRAKQAVVETRSGQRYSGVVRTEDNFSIALQTVSGEFVLMQKSELSRISYNSAGWMPSDYASRLSAHELDDIVSYLMHLQPVDSSVAKRDAKRHWDDEN